MDDGTSRAGRRNAFGVIAGALFVIGPALAWLRIVPGIAGFGLFALGGMVGLVAGVASVVQAARGRGLGRGGALAVAVGAVFLALASRGAGKPRINDFTTDLADPPALAHAATLPPNVARDMSYPKAFADIQRGCCADLHPARVRAGAPEAFTRAEAVARRMGLTVTRSEPSAGLLEATATSRLFGFQDDIAIRVRPETDGTSRIDMRSKSRDGQGDFGVNAARIRTFVQAVEAAGAPPR
jgi:uncharacterized protein (DUF1499 family)